VIASLKDICYRKSGIKVSLNPMGRPKLSEEEKQGQIPLRVPKGVAAALEEIAREWTERAGKEIKKGTVAREMVLIGLGVFMALKHQRIFAEFGHEAEDSEAQQARLVEIASAAEDLFSQSKNRNIDPEMIEKAIMESLKLVKETVLNDMFPAQPSSTSRESQPRIPVLTGREPNKKGGKT
jgi:hypothetical protein